MFKILCSPEIRFTMSSEDQPHAYVAYTDDEKDCVPLYFIQKFPKKWRDTGKQGGDWDHQYLYKVFWSPDENDSPQQMLKRVAEIPVFEDNSPKEQAGYYRASVLAVEETLPKLHDLIDKGKRIRCGLARYKYTSFEEECKKSTKTKVRHIKPETISKKRKSSNKGSVKQKKGIKLDAHVSNTASLRCDLAKRFPHLITSKVEEQVDSSSENNNEESDAEQDLGNEPTAKSVLQDDKEKPQQDPFEDDEIKYNQFTISVDKPNPVSSNKKVHENPGSESRTPVTPPLKRTISETNKEEGIRCQRRSASKGKKLKDISSSSDTDEFCVSNKMIKMDPDYTPRKYEEAKADLLIYRNTVKRISNLNFCLQEKVLKLESEKAEMEGKISSLEMQISQMTQKSFKMNSTQSTIDKINRSTPNKTSTKRVLEFSGKDTIKNDDMLDFDFMNDGVQNLCETVMSPGADVQESESTTCSASKDFKPYDTEVEALMSHEEKVTPKRQDDKVLDSEVSNPETCEENEETTKPLELCEGVFISAEVRKLIWSIDAGEKKDLRFIKDLSVAAFGPEILASSSIMGTRKGGVKKKDTSVERKPALNKKILQAIKDALIKRAEREEGSKIQEPNSHKRTSTSRMFEAIRGAQKRCRQLGYGTGSKSNEVTLDLLRTKDKQD